ncbi:hypothetical protein SAMN04487926_14260 [Paraburkholderia steynii]|uniref:DUF6429 domain-containing protein n=1 Tax=Paraburkholderia steynii TaxID=1245441 RepID=A0A7Z7FMV5_9BURK|nr:DUF6429 family protein [Paraburkholderia steynii]SDJ31569.1 hypothetical protein SAMN04487926_14260 [Paraburkholderia steynii]
MDIDTAAVDNAALALRYLTLHDHDRVWKNFGGDVMNWLYSMIDDPVNKAKSVVLIDEGLCESKHLFKQHFSAPAAKVSHETNF